MQETNRLVRSSFSSKDCLLNFIQLICFRNSQTIRTEPFLPRVFFWRRIPKFGQFGSNFAKYKKRTMAYSNIFGKNGQKVLGTILILKRKKDGNGGFTVFSNISFPERIMLQSLSFIQVFLQVSVSFTIQGVAHPKIRKKERLHKQGTEGRKHLLFIFTDSYEEVYSSWLQIFRFFRQ